MIRRPYEELRDEVRRRQAEGTLRASPTREERIDWAYWNAVIENPEITPEAVERAFDRSRSAKEDLTRSARRPSP